MSPPFQPEDVARFLALFPAADRASMLAHFCRPEAAPVHEVLPTGEVITRIPSFAELVAMEGDPEIQAALDEVWAGCYAHLPEEQIVAVLSRFPRSTLEATLRRRRTQHGA